MKKWNKILLGVLTGVVLAASAFLYMRQSAVRIESKTVSEMQARAAYFFEQGDIKRGLYQLEVYLQAVPWDTDTWQHLAELYESYGDAAHALDCWQHISALVDRSDAPAGVLHLDHTAMLLQKTIKDPKITIAPETKFTKNMVLRVSRNNLVSEKRYYGTVSGNLEKLQGSDTSKQTTDWFPVDASAGHLTLTGAFNEAVWQFRDGQGNILKANNSEGKQFRDTTTVNFQNKSYASIEIPQRAAEARVTYWNQKLEESTSTGESAIYVNYGTVPAANSGSGCTEYVLPDLKEGEQIIYENGAWSFYGADGTKKSMEDLGSISLMQGDTISVFADLYGTVTVEGTETDAVVTDGVYGIRWKQEEQEPVAERIGDAVNLQFNYYADDQWVYPVAKNDFDQIYPWSEMRLCAIDASGTVTYEGEEGFALDGSCGDVMVEIPVHYFKREIADGYESIWISASKQEGFMIDPAFVTADGVQDHIYVGAYLNNVNVWKDQDDNLHFQIFNHADSFVALNFTANAVNSLAFNKGARWHNLDLATLSMLQRLFLVETGIRNSQMLFTGNVSYNFGSVSDRESKEAAYAISGDGTKGNVLELADSSRNWNFQVGDAVAIFQVAQDADFYSEINKGYNNTEEWNRVITEVDANTKGILRITFDGAPIEIQARETAIQHLPPKNGKTAVLSYHTGETDGNPGQRSFKWRNLENLWGSSAVIVSNVSILEHEVKVVYPDGSSSTLSYRLPLQEQNSSNRPAGVDVTAAAFGFDPANPAILLPGAVGEGANLTDGFGDALFYRNEVRMNEQNERDANILLVGGAWDISQYAGLFYYNANSFADQHSLEQGSRLVYR